MFWQVLAKKCPPFFPRTIWPQAMLQNENTITAFTFVASSLHSNQSSYPIGTKKNYSFPQPTCMCEIWQESSSEEMFDNVDD